MTSNVIVPPQNDADPIWNIYRTFPIVGANNDGTIYHHQWQKIIDALNLLLSMSGNTGTGVPGTGGTVHITPVSSNYTMLPIDTVLLVSPSSLTTITLPQTLTSTDVGKMYFIKDSLGVSETHNIVISPGATYIDSPSSSPNQNQDLINGNAIIDENFACLTFCWTGSFWHII
jgi:hypothetical protein